MNDPVKCMEHVLASASTPSLSHAFSTPHTYLLFCMNCNPTAPYPGIECARPIAEDALVTNLIPDFTDREIRYAKPASRSLDDMLQTKQGQKEYSVCNECNRPDSFNQK
jgi:hypothetical protein